MGLGSGWTSPGFSGLEIQMEDFGFGSAQFTVRTGDTVLQVVELEYVDLDPGSTIEARTTFCITECGASGPITLTDCNLLEGSEAISPAFPLVR